MVALILAFIFLTPRELFRDQPKASSIVMLPAQNGANVFWVEPELLVATPDGERSSQAEKFIQGRYGKKFKLGHLETIYDAENDIKGFMAYTKP